MKTIEEKAQEYAENIVKQNSKIFDKHSMDMYVFSGNDMAEAYMDGIEFAQHWNDIERDKDGFTTNDQDKELFENCPFLTEDIYGNMEVWDYVDNDVQTKPIYISWRPIEYK